MCVLGLGEAGFVISGELARLGVVTSGFDPSPVPAPPGVARADSPSAAAAGADVILSLNSQASAVEAAESVGDQLEGALYADLNTTSPAVKREVAAIVSAAGADFADVALLGPVPKRGLATPCIVSGSGAARFAQAFSKLGMPIETIGPVPGDASARKLLRSVFMKGIAAACLESLAAARAAGCERWVRDQIIAVMEEADAAFVERLVVGSGQHARRRVDELEAARSLLVELGVEPRTVAAASAILRDLA
jgi:3-hydroxyisobutyrate dehydrogenase-like beta-hydroxyacid dehydrogenase